MRQDYFMRLIEQVAQMLSVVLALNHAGKTAEASQELDLCCRRTTGLPLGVVRNSSPETLIEFLEQGGGLRYARAVMLAELLLQEMELDALSIQPEERLRIQHLVHGLLASSIPFLSREEAAHFRPKLEILEENLRTSATVHIPS